MSIDAYLTDMKLVWSPSTFKSERSRLRRAQQLLGGSTPQPDAAWRVFLLCFSPYAASISFTRWLEYKRWRGDSDVSDWERYRKKHIRNKYQRKLPSVSFEEAKDRLSKLSPPHRRKALELLHTGLRYSEYERVEGKEVVGKGSKRRVLVGKVSGVQVKDKAFRAELRQAGLKPHDLRKIFATKLAKEGMNVFDLCAVMGWSGLNTAQSYVSASSNLKEKVNDIVGEI